MEWRAVEHCKKPAAKRKIYNFHPHSTPVSFADTLSPGEGIGVHRIIQTARKLEFDGQVAGLSLRYLVR